MTKKPLKRDNSYFLERLRKEHPGVYSDYQTGKYRNLSAALVAAGLRQDRSGLHGLKSLWKKASQADRDAFKTFIGCVAPPAAIVVPEVSMPTPTPIASAIPSTSPRSPSSTLRNLPPALANEIRVIMDRRGISTGPVMSEMNLDTLNPSLGTALRRGTRVQESLIEKLEIWVKANRSA